MSDNSIDAQMAQLMARDESPAAPPTLEAITPPIDPNAAPASPPAPPVDPNAAPTFTPDQLADRDRQSRAALREERQMRRQLEQQARAYQEQAQRSQQQMQALLERMALQTGQPAPAAPQPIDPDANPLDALKALHAKVQQYEQREQDAVRQQQAREQQAREQQAQQYQQAQYINEVARTLSDFESDFSISTPDYEDAAKHYVDVRYRTLRAQFPQESEERVRGHIQLEILNMADNAMRNRANPAELIYAAAKEFGYARKAPAAAVMPQAPAAQSVDPLAAIRAGQAASQSLSAGGSPASGNDGMSVANILKLQGAAFNSATDAFLRKMIRGE